MNAIAQPDLWAAVTAARLPATGLPALGPVRNLASVRITLDGNIAWVTWPVGSTAVVNCLRPVAGVTFYRRHGHDWIQLGRRVPTAVAPPAEPGRSLDAILHPARFTPTPPVTVPRAVPVRLVPDHLPRPATALSCSLAALAAWADDALTVDIQAVNAAHCGDRVLLRGALPVIAGAARFWGKTVLIPLGYRVEPNVSESVIRTAARLAADEVLIFATDDPEAIPVAAFMPLTRASVRLAAMGGRP